MQKAKRQDADFFLFFDAAVFAGFTYFITYGSLMFVWYLAMDGTLRSKGYGTQILRWIRDTYPNHRLVLNIKAQDQSAANREQRKRRRRFYLKNGYRPMGSLFLTRILRLRGEPAVKAEARDCVTSFRFLLKPAYVKQVTGLFTVLKIDVKIRFG